MHYKNGTPAQAGDLVLHTDNFGETSGQQLVGILSTGNSNSTTCNGGLFVIARRAKSALGWGPWTPVMNEPSDWSCTLSQCEKIESVPVAEAAPEPAVAEAETKEAVSAA